MDTRSSGLTADPLFVGATRPAMRWGVTYAALLLNMVVTMEVFLLTRNLLTLPLCLPVHAVCMLLCAHDPRFFDLVLLWARTRLPTTFGNLWFWKAGSYSPLALSVPDPVRKPASSMKYIGAPAAEPCILAGIRASQLVGYPVTV